MAKKDSVMFTKDPPRRLRQDMFEGSCKSPMKEIYTRHAEVLQDVVGGKVTKVIKWKIRKMRANPLPRKKSLQSDNFDFEALARKIKRERLGYCTPRPKKTVNSSANSCGPSSSQTAPESITPLVTPDKNDSSTTVGGEWMSE